MTKIYMDNVSGTPMHPKVIEAITPFLQEGFGNPSNLHQFGRATSEAIQTARGQTLLKALLPLSKAILY